MGYSIEVLKVLMWKHAVVRLRRFLNTPIEIIAPILLFLLMYLIRNNFKEIKQTVEHTDIPKPATITLPFKLDRIITRVLYTPVTPLTQELMNSVGEDLNLSRQNTIPDHITKGYWGVSNETHISEFAKKMKYNEAIVIFQKQNSDTMPKELVYTIRMNEPYLTETTAALDPRIGRHEEFGTVYEPFMRLQWAIDKNFLQMHTGATINRDLSFQEFPYVPNARADQIAYIKCLVVSSMATVALLLPFMFLVNRLLFERASGIQELVKMVGVTSNMLGISHFLNTIPSMLSYALIGTMLLKVSSTPIIQNTGYGPIAILFILHFTSIMAAAFACSFITKSTSFSTPIALLCYVVLYLPSQVIPEEFDNSLLRFVCGFLPHMPLMWFWSEVGQLEMYGEGLTFGAMLTRHGAGGCAALCYALLAAQAAWLFLLAWYLERVRPGAYGVALPWNFLCQRSFWSKRVTPDVEELSLTETREEPQYFEEAPENAEVGIKIVNVSKVFGSRFETKTVALSHMNLDIYKNEITVLVGHNGAGKTTLMSIISGIYSATEGHVYVNGLDNVKERNRVRRDMGMCPQHNLFFTDLTVIEHLIFFAMLKGHSRMGAKEKGAEIIERLNLKSKANNLAGELSGGMKRRLQLACALVGGASVLILDEPTSGLDVETRRELWDILLTLRENRTVLLSTHFMEEADALGDRVAAVHAGRLRCRASPMFLKRAIGTGYRLSLTLRPGAAAERVSAAVAARVGGARLAERAAAALAFTLPADASPQFPQLFAELEARRDDLGIEAIGIGISTLEEVFLKLCSDVDITDIDDDSAAPATTYRKVTGARLLWQQTLILFRRQLLWTNSVKVLFILLQFILPLVVISLFTFLNKSTAQSDRLHNPPVTMNIDLYGNMDERGALYKLGNGTSIMSLKNTYKDVRFTPSDDIIEEAVRTGNRSLLQYKNTIAGFEIDEHSARVFYTTLVRHAAPVALNLMSNALASSLLPWANGRTITTVNHPIQYEFTITPLAEARTTLSVVQFAFVVGIVIMATLSNEVTLACRERVQGARHFHIMSGAHPALYWAVAWLYDILIYTICIILPLIILCRFLDQEETLNRPDFLGVLFLVLLLGGMSFLSLVYFVSFFFTERINGLVLSIILFVFGLIAPIIRYGADLTQTEDLFTLLFCKTGLLTPPYSFVVALIAMGKVARLNSMCHQNKHKCPNIPYLDVGFDSKICCAWTHDNRGPWAYFTSSSKIPYHILNLLILLVLYSVLVLLVEYRWFNRLWDRIVNRDYIEPDRKYNDRMVAEEMAYVSNNIKKPDESNAMLAHNLHKRYVKMCRATNSVKGISFSVKQGECFGLLGVNGAGKSTTFKMMTADEAMTKGDLVANKYKLRGNRSKYLHSLGYCPQFDGVDKFMTGADSLRLLLTLRGHGRKDVETETTAWIQCVGLERYAARPMAGYSGGCARRLAAAAALAGGAALALLDEPTAGVDAAARRRVWRALRRGLREHRAVVITSHSMDEMEALCGRIAIMSRGEICALGSAPALRAAHAVGYALRLKLRPAPAAASASASASASTAAAPSPVDLLKSAMNRKFQCELKDEHQTMLHYHISDKIPYSQLFQTLEELKAEHAGIVEDYSATETTLEEVFLLFAKQKPYYGPVTQVYTQTDRAKSTGTP